MVKLGTLPSGGQLIINKLAVETELLIAEGFIEAHFFAGFSGGRKSILPGVAGMQSLRIHHSFPIRPAEPVMGWIEGNPFHLTALEAAKMAPVRFIVNLIQNPYKDFVGAVAGDLELAHSKGVELCRRISEVKINGRADTIIVSPGGFPRDRDLYQSQKALSVAELLGTDTCSFIIAAECRDGIGNQTFMQWMLEGSSPEEIMNRFKATGFDAGNNKAYNFARALTKGRVIIVSDRLNPELIRAMLLEWAPDLGTALKMAAVKKKPNKILVIPWAVNVVPIID
jgi:nickel-dependent lactate racemase